MRFLVSEKLGPHKYKTPEGYLICVDAILSRTGTQEYRRSELFGDSCEEPEKTIYVDRKEDEVFSDKAMASFENKAICIEHPDEAVNVNNHNELSVGFIRDIKRGEDNGRPVMLGTLVITDADAVKAVEDNEYTELSCGYDCDIDDVQSPNQKNIRGNHVALCKEGRAGIARIVDSINDINFKYMSNEAKELKSRLQMYKRVIGSHASTGNKAFTHRTSGPQVQELNEAINDAIELLASGIADSSAWKRLALKLESWSGDNENKQLAAKAANAIHIFEKYLNNKHDAIEKIKDAQKMTTNKMISIITPIVKSYMSKKQVDDADWRIYSQNKKVFISAELDFNDFDTLLDTINHKLEPITSSYFDMTQVGMASTTIFDAINDINDDASNNEYISNVWLTSQLKSTSVPNEIWLHAKRHFGFTEADKPYVYPEIEEACKTNINDADKYTFKLAKRKNDYGEFVIRAYKNGSYNEDATYYTDDWADAVGTLNDIAKRQGLTVKTSGSIQIADNNAYATFNDKIEQAGKDETKLKAIIKQVENEQGILGSDKQKLITKANANMLKDSIYVVTYAKDNVTYIRNVKATSLDDVIKIVKML